MKNQLRPVEFWDQGNCIKGFFHQLVGGYMSEVQAVVEKEDGWIIVVPFSGVKFTDREEQ